MTTSPHVSIIVPFKDEQENVLPILEEVRESSEDWPFTWELVFVDDGSVDETWELIKKAKVIESRVRAVRFMENCGQTSALVAGIRHSRGAICVTMDGDCQNDPSDIVRLTEAMKDAEMVIGWRQNRADSGWRRFQSRLANGFRNWMTGESVRDIGCALKAFEREKMLEIPLFEGMHRFLPTLFRYRNWRVVEVPVKHRPRRRGQTKYGMWNRVFEALRDLFAVRWMRRRMIRYRLRDEDTID